MPAAGLINGLAVFFTDKQVSGSSARINRPLSRCSATGFNPPTPFLALLDGYRYHKTEQPICKMNVFLSKNECPFMSKAGDLP